MPLKLSVPQPLWSYLGRLAELTALGSSETEVALFLLKERVVELQRDGFLDKSLASILRPEDDDG